mmetsp:Transcript_37969/g.61252  ORF Transcript_37969/g.61252 Transcript_37969/m.61252 type:complete len:153 (+) Transcript_37969:265-723(+)
MRVCWAATGNANEPVNSHWKHLALNYLQQVHKISHESQDRALESRLCSQIGSLLHSMGQYSEALDLYLHQLEAATQVKDALQIACAKGNLGLIFQVHGQHQRALEFHRKNLIIAMMRCQLCNIEEENIAQHNLEESCRHLDSDNSVGGDFTR